MHGHLNVKWYRCKVFLHRKGKWVKKRLVTGKTPSICTLYSSPPHPFCYSSHFDLALRALRAIITKFLCRYAPNPPPNFLFIFVFQLPHHFRIRTFTVNMCKVSKYLCVFFIVAPGSFQSVIFRSQRLKPSWCIRWPRQKTSSVLVSRMSCIHKLPNCDNKPHANNVTQVPGFIPGRAAPT